MQNHHFKQFDYEYERNKRYKNNSEIVNYSFEVLMNFYTKWRLTEERLFSQQDRKSRENNWDNYCDIRDNMKLGANALLRNFNKLALIDNYVGIILN